MDGGVIVARFCAWGLFRDASRWQDLRGRFLNGLVLLLQTPRGVTLSQIVTWIKRRFRVPRAIDMLNVKAYLCANDVNCTTVAFPSRVVDVFSHIPRIVEDSAEARVRAIFEAALARSKADPSADLSLSVANVFSTLVLRTHDSTTVLLSACDAK